MFVFVVVGVVGFLESDCVVCVLDWVVVEGDVLVCGADCGGDALDLVVGVLGCVACCVVGGGVFG